jgi:GNAT superfamily N-acetyltransferase
VHPAPGTTLEPVPHLLREHLRDWAGAWPPTLPVTVAPNPRRAQPGWDGSTAPVAGVALPDGSAVVGLPPDVAASVPPGVGLEELLASLPDLLGTAGSAMRGVHRWTTEPTPGPDEGVWVSVAHPAVPPWLHPFGDRVLLALDDDGHYLAGVGLKRHDRFGQEIAVGTAERARGRGLARRLVAQAARHVLAAGAVPTYLHDPRNEASARVAAAAGFPDRGWQVLGVFPHPPGSPGFRRR